MRAQNRAAVALPKVIALGFALFAFTGAMAVALAPGKLAQTFACRSDPDGKLVLEIAGPTQVGAPVKAFVALKSAGACFEPVRELDLAFRLLRDGAVVDDEAALAPLPDGTTIPPWSAKDPTGTLYRVGIPDAPGAYVAFAENADPPWRGATPFTVR